MRAADAVRLAVLAAALSGCGSRPPAAPPLADPPVVGTVSLRRFQPRVPAQGLALGDGDFEVALGADDARGVRIGSRAWLRPEAAGPAVAARVARLVGSAGGGLVLAWIRPAGPVGVPAGSFAVASVATGPARTSPAVPTAAVYLLDGRTVVLEPSPAREGLPYVPVAVRVGLRQGGWAEVLSGLAPGARVVTRGGIGFLYPDFKSQGSD